MIGIMSFSTGVLAPWGGLMLFMGRTRGTNVCIIGTQRRTAIRIITTIVLGWMLNNSSQKKENFWNGTRILGKAKNRQRIKGQGLRYHAYESYASL